jgi:hypothetical protein
MEHEDLTHDIILGHIEKVLSRDYKQIGVNRHGEKKAAYKEHYPDMILGNHGMVLALLELETEGSVSEKAVERWKALSKLGVKLTIIVPKAMKVKATDLIWKNGMMGKVSLGTYEFVIKMS